MSHPVREKGSMFRYAAYGCHGCDTEWADELPPVWSDYWPRCRECDLPGTLAYLLVERMGSEMEGEVTILRAA